LIPSRDGVWDALFASGRDEPGALLEGLWLRLVDEGVALKRATVALRTLHPEIVGLGYVWELGKPIQRNQHAHGEFNLPRFLASPFRVIFDGGGPLRTRLVGDEPQKFPVLDELRARGMTDYLALPLTFSSGQIHALTVASDRPGGFTDAEVALFHDLSPALAACIEARETRRVAGMLLDTYVGARAGAEVLEGRIRRGDVDMLDAVVLSCDLRGFTRLTTELPPTEVVGLLNDYFERVCAPIVAGGGEVMKFIGVGLLATFPVELAGAARACQAALEAARAGLASVDGKRFGNRGVELRMGVALHLGEVAFGNIGAPNRLDFTVIGQAVNLASRLAGLCARLEHSLLVSAAFAARSPAGARSLGVHSVRGLDEPQEVFTY
jgi:adenylate cyclase